MSNVDNYAAQGGSSHHIGGKLDVDSGGEIAVKSGGSIGIESGGDITQEDGGNHIVPVQTESTGGSAEESGLSIVETTGAAIKTFPMDAPVTGVVKTIFAKTVNSTANTPVADAGAGVTFDGSNRYARFRTAGAAVQLVAESATRWLVVGSVGTVAYTTSDT